MKVFVVLVIVAFTVCSAGSDYQHHSHGHHDDDGKEDNSLLRNAFFKYVAKETNHDHTADLKRCHLSDKINDIFSKSTNTIKKVLIFLYKSVASVIEEFLFKIQYKIDHVVVHVKSFMKKLKNNQYHISKELEDTFQYKLEDLKKDTVHYSGDLDYKGLKEKIRKTLEDLKGYAKKDVTYSGNYNYKDDKKDLKKEFQDYLDYCKKHLLDVTKHYEGTIDSKIYGLFHKDDDKKGKSTFRRRFSCRAVKGKLKYLWDKFCKYSH